MSLDFHFRLEQAGNGYCVKTTRGSAVYVDFWMPGDRAAAAAGARNYLKRIDPSAKAVDVTPKAAKPKSKPEPWEQREGESTRDFIARLAETAAELHMQLSELRGREGAPASTASKGRLPAAQKHALDVAMNLKSEERGIISTASKLSFGAIKTPAPAHDREALKQKMGLGDDNAPRIENGRKLTFRTGGGK